MTITQVFLLLVCAFVLVLLLSILFKRYHRTIMWSAAIVFFIGTLLLIGLGIIDPVKDNNHPNPVVITGIFTALVLSGVFAYGAEKLRIKLREKNQQSVQPIDNHSECPDSPKGVVLSGRLDTSLARTIFAKAIEAGYIEEVGSHYSWKGTKALLAYMCGRIYCGDYPEYSKYEQKTFWEFGNGLFPDVELNALFEQTGIGQSRQNRRDMPVPNNAGEIDKFFRSDKKRRVLSSFLASLSFWLVMHFVLLHLAIFDFFNFIFLFFVTGNQLVTYKVVTES